MQIDSLRSGALYHRMALQMGSRPRLVEGSSQEQPQQQNWPDGQRDLHYPVQVEDEAERWDGLA